MSELQRLYDFAMYHYGEFLHKDMLVSAYICAQIKRLFPTLDAVQVEQVWESLR